MFVNYYICDNNNSIWSKAAVANQCSADKFKYYLFGILFY